MANEELNENQIYLGIEPHDLAVFEKYRNSAATPTPGFYTDFMGVKTRLSYFGITDSQIDKQVGKPPFPDDGVHAEAIEYLAALHAVETSEASFTAVEFGAGYAPWLTFSAKAAQRAGIEKINILAVEADRDRHALMRSHLGDNGLPVPAPNSRATVGEASATLIYGAISDTNGTVTFGSQSITDWGAAPIEDGGNVDYRGYETKGVTVDTYTIDRVLTDLPLVDFLHMDIQGFEARSVEASLLALKEKVRVMLIATHSRQIEGELFGLLYGKGWRILYEKPCKFRRKDGGALEAHTTVDGTQVWVNTALDEARKTADTPELAKARHKKESDWLRGELIIARERADFLQGKLDEANGAIDTLRREVTNLKAEVAALRSSTSWKVTAPLRKLKGA